MAKKPEQGSRRNTRNSKNNRKELFKQLVTKHEQNISKASLRLHEDIDRIIEESEEQLEVTNINKSSNTEQITQFINKLFTKNKVNIRNAFDVPILNVDSINRRVNELNKSSSSPSSSLNEDLWKTLSSTLQNDYKIYGYRVDATHNITYRMLESINRHENTTVNQNEKEQLIEKKNLFWTGELIESKFIEKNIKNLNAQLFQTFLNTNPIVERVKRKFDQTGLKTMLLNTISLSYQLELSLHFENQIEKNQIAEKINKKTVQLKNQLFTHQINKDFSIIREITQMNNQIQEQQETCDYHKMYNAIDRNKTKSEQLMNQQNMSNKQKYEQKQPKNSPITHEQRDIHNEVQQFIEKPIKIQHQRKLIIEDKSNKNNKKNNEPRMKKISQYVNVKINYPSKVKEQSKRKKSINKILIKRQKKQKKKQQTDFESIEKFNKNDILKINQSDKWLYSKKQHNYNHKVQIGKHTQSYYQDKHLQDRSYQFQEILRKSQFLTEIKQDKYIEKSNENDYENEKYFNDSLGIESTKRNQNIPIREAKDKVKKLVMFQGAKCSFRKVYNEYVKQQGHITLALCFLTILHLANENNLQLTPSSSEGSNFTIFKQNCMNEQINQ